MAMDRPQRKAAERSPYGRKQDPDARRKLSLPRRPANAGAPPTPTPPTRTPPSPTPAPRTRTVKPSLPNNQAGPKATPVPSPAQILSNAACHQNGNYRPQPLPEGSSQVSQAQARYVWPQATMLSTPSGTGQATSQTSQTSDLAEELTRVIKALPPDLQKAIDLAKDDINWDELLMKADLDKYTGDKLVEVFGIFYHVKELWKMEKEQRLAQRQGEERK